MHPKVYAAALGNNHYGCTGSEGRPCTLGCDIDADYTEANSGWSTCDTNGYRTLDLWSRTGYEDDAVNNNKQFTFLHNDPVRPGCGIHALSYFKERVLQGTAIAPGKWTGASVQEQLTTSNTAGLDVQVMKVDSVIHDGGGDDKLEVHYRLKVKFGDCQSSGTTSECPAYTSLFTRNANNKKLCQRRCVDHYDNELNHLAEERCVIDDKQFGETVSITTTTAASLRACQAECLATTGCNAVQYNTGATIDNCKLTTASEPLALTGGSSDFKVSRKECFSNYRLKHAGGCVCYYFGDCAGITDLPNEGVSLHTSTSSSELSPKFSISPTGDYELKTMHARRLLSQQEVSVQTFSVLPWVAAQADKLSDAEKAMTVNRGAYWCPAFGTHRFETNRCRMPMRFKSSAKCNEYCDGCNFCVGVWDEKSTVCACRANGLSRRVSLADAAEGVRVRGAPLASTVVQRYYDAMQRIYIDSVAAHLHPEAKPAADDFEDLTQSATGHSVQSAQPGRRLLSSSLCASKTINRVNSQTKYSVDISECMQNVQDGERVQVTVKAFKADNSQIGASKVFYGDKIDLRHTVLRGGVSRCYKDKNCNNGRGVMHKFSRTRDSHASDWGWNAFIDSRSTDDNTGLKQTIEQNAHSSAMRLHVYGTCTKEGEVHTLINSRMSHTTSSTNEQNAIMISVTTPCVITAEFVKTKDRLYEVPHKDIVSIQPVYTLQTTCTSNNCATPKCKLYRPKLPTGVTFDQDNCQFSGSYQTTQACRARIQKVHLILANGRVADRANVRIVCLRRTAADYVRKSLRYKVGALQLAQANSHVSGDDMKFEDSVNTRVVFNPATMQKVAPVKSAGSSQAAVCAADSGASFNSVSTGINVACCAQRLTEAGKSLATYTQRRCASVTVNSALQDSDAQITQLVPKIAARLTGASIKVEVICAAESFWIQCREEGSEHWNPCSDEINVSLEGCSGSREHTFEIDSLRFDEEVQFRIAFSKGSDRAFSAFESMHTITASTMIDSMIHGETVRIRGGDRTSLVTVLDISVANTGNFLEPNTVMRCPAVTGICRLKHTPRSSCSQLYTDTPTAQNTRTDLRGQNWICCLMDCGHRSWRTAVPVLQIKSAVKKKLINAIAEVVQDVETPEGATESIEVEALESGKSGVVRIKITDSSRFDTLMRSHLKRSAMSSDESGISVTLPTKLSAEGVTATSILQSAIKQRAAFSVTGSMQIQREASTHDAASDPEREIRTMLIRTISEAAILPETAVNVVEFNTDSTFSSVSYKVEVSSSDETSVHAQSRLQKAISGTVNFNGELTNQFKAHANSQFIEIDSIMETHSQRVKGSELQQTSVATTRLQLCDQVISGKTVRLVGGDTVELACDDNQASALYVLQRAGGLRLDNVDVVGKSGANSYVPLVLIEDRDVLLDLSGVRYDGPLSSVFKETSMSTSDAAQAASAINIRGFKSTNANAGTQLALTSSVSGANMASANGVLAAKMNARQRTEKNVAAGRLEVKGDIDKASFIRTGIDDFKDIPRRKLMVNGEERDMLEMALMDGAAVAAKVYWNEDAASDLNCDHVSTQFTPNVGQGREAQYASLIRTDSIESAVAVHRQCSDTQCGCDNPAGNSLAVRMSNDVQSVSRLHCKCSPDECNSAQTFFDADGNRCEWENVGGEATCEVSDSAGNGFKWCSMHNIMYSSNVIVGSSQSPGITVSLPICILTPPRAWLTLFNLVYYLLGLRSVSHCISNRHPMLA